MSYNNPKNANKFRCADKQRPTRNNAGGGPKTKNRLNRNAVGVAKARTTVYSSAQQKIALVRNVTRRAIIRTLYCFSKDVSLLSEDNNLEFEEDAFLGSLESHDDTQWHATVGLNQKNVKFKLDTGAEVTAISEITFHDTTLKRSTKALYGPAHTPLKVIGQFTGNFTGNFRYNNTHCKLHVYVVKDLKTITSNYCSESCS